MNSCPMVGRSVQVNKHQQHIGESAASNRHEERLAPEMNQDGDDDGQSHAPVETMLPL